MHACRSRFLSMLALAAAPACIVAQVQWSRPPLFHGRDRSCVAYDSIRGRVVLFGGRATDGSALDETWEWDGTSWTQRHPAHRPSPRESTMVFDSGRGRIVLFGGTRWPNLLGDTWEWDGSDWTERFPAAAPPPRSGHGMAYDAARGRTVLFDGFTDGLVWEWDGSRWSSHATLNWPYFRGPLAYDARRQRVVLAAFDTWEWDGLAWTIHNPNLGPSPSVSPGLAYDAARDRTVFLGTYGLNVETWEWNRALVRWTRLAPRHQPPPAFHHALVYDSARQRVLAFGAMDQSTATWEWDGIDWSERLSSHTPTGVLLSALVADTTRGVGVLLANQARNITFSDTWTWDGRSWTRLAAAGPRVEGTPTLAFDSHRGRAVTFGGSTQGETWEWDGSAWLQLQPPVAPSARSGHALAFDAVRGRTILFGGHGQNVVLDDTWEWDGSRWVQAAPPARPRARVRHALAFDPTRGRVVLFGGATAISLTPVLDDLWEWDGSRWTDRTPAVRPPPRVGPAFATDPERRRAVLFGGQDSTFQALDDVWEWDGARWLQRALAPGPQGRLQPCLASAPGGHGLLLFGGGNFLSDTWRLTTQFPASWTPGGAGCAGSAGTPQLQPLLGGLPWLGDALRLELRDLVPGRSSLVWLGSSDQNWNRVPLPLDLTGIGMPGCALRAAPTAAFPVFNLTGRTALEVGVPDDRSLLGRLLFAQALALDPGANAFGATVSNSGAARFGAK